MAKFKLILLGAGRVGTAFLEILARKRKILEEKYNLEYELVGISDLKYGSILDNDGIPINKILKTIREKGRFIDNTSSKEDIDNITLIKSSDSNLLIETTWSNIKDGEPALTHILSSIRLGKHVVTTNKGPFAVAYKKIIDEAKKHNVFVRFEGTVLSGTPVISLARECLAGCEIIEIQGILNGTTNYILTRMEEGISFNEALREAQKLGYAETDPSSDIDGWDAAAKAVILANSIMNGNLTINDVFREGIRNISTRYIQENIEKGRRTKLLANIIKEGKKIYVEVKPRDLPISHPLSSVMGPTNAVTFKTDHLNRVTIIGPGAGPIEAAQALVMDMITINNYLEWR
jgi:homoserine dehydrogenase